MKKFIVLILLLLPALACSQTPKSSPSTDSTKGNTPEKFFANPVDGESQLDSLIRTAQNDLAKFWQSYSKPSKVASYSRSEAELGNVRTPCGTLTPNNAIFCPEERSVYYDRDFLNDLSRYYGDYAPVTVIAHEWGHLIQWQKYGQGNAERDTIEKEQEADCLAGAYTNYADQVSQLLEVGDYEEAAKTMYKLGDNLDWFDSQAHGSPELRVAAFTRGAFNGAESCWGYTAANSFPSSAPNNIDPSPTPKVNRINPTPTKSVLLDYSSYRCNTQPSTPFYAGLDVEVITDVNLPLRLRAKPDMDNLSSVYITSYHQGTKMRIIDGPACSDNVVWWLVKVEDGKKGWIAEGDGSEYFIEPVN